MCFVGRALKFGPQLGFQSLQGGRQQFILGIVRILVGFFAKQGRHGGHDGPAG